MYAQCPECQTVFRVRAAQLRVANGKVRCSRCHTVFDALKTLREDVPPAQVADEPPEPVHERDPNTVGDLFESQSLTENEALALDAGAERTVPMYRDAVPPETLDPVAARASSLARDSGRTHSWLWALGSLLLTLLLAGQAVHAWRVELARTEPVGAWLQTVYDWLQIDIPTPRDLTRLTVRQADIASHPTLPGVLQLNAALVNRADFAQDWPVIKLRLEDRWGDTVGLRYFHPDDYLQPPPETLLPAREETVVTLDLVDPGPDAVGFLMDTCFPRNQGYICHNALRDTP